MVAKWEYYRFHDDSFLLVCRANCQPSELDDHPSVRAFETAVEGARVIDKADPEGPARDPRHWRGRFTLGTLEFHIPAVYSFHKFFGLVCDPIADNGRANYHDPENIRTVIKFLNDGIEEGD